MSMGRNESGWLLRFSGSDVNKIDILPILMISVCMYLGCHWWRTWITLGWWYCSWWYRCLHWILLFRYAWWDIYIYVTFDTYWDKLSSSVAVGMNLGIEHDKKKLLKNNQYLFQKFTISCFSFLVIWCLVRNF